MKFSFIICTYNAELRLPATLDSILAQNFEDFEVVVIDGKSSDNTVHVIKKYQTKFNGRLRWISEKDGGVYEAINKGIKLAQGDFLNIIGAGDWLELGVLDKIAQQIQENFLADAIYGSTKIWEKNKKHFRIAHTDVFALPNHPMQHPALFYRKKLHEKYGLYDESYRIASDYVFCLKTFFLNKVNIIEIEAVLVNFVMDGLSSENFWKTQIENKKALRSVGLKNRNFYRTILTYYKKKLLK